MGSLKAFHLDYETQEQWNFSCLDEVVMKYLYITRLKFGEIQEATSAMHLFQILSKPHNKPIILTVLRCEYTDRLFDRQSANFNCHWAKTVVVVNTLVGTAVSHADKEV